jgi:hypothetical protein
MIAGLDNSTGGEPIAPGAGTTSGKIGEPREETG